MVNNQATWPRSEVLTDQSPSSTRLLFCGPQPTRVPPDRRHSEAVRSLIRPSCSISAWAADMKETWNVNNSCWVRLVGSGKD